MKHKLTITVDADLLPVARQYAAAKGISLSALIEHALRELTSEETPTFSTRWRGRFEMAERENDDRYDALINKYLT